MWVKLVRPFYINGAFLGVGRHQFSDDWYVRDKDPEKAKADKRPPGLRLPLGAEIVDGPEEPPAPKPIEPVVLSSLSKGTEIDPATGKPKSTTTLEQEEAAKKKAAEEAAKAAAAGKT